MNAPVRRILLAVEPAFLEGALAELLSPSWEVVQLSRGTAHGYRAPYDAAVVADRLPSGVRADVVITLPDTRGSAGTGTVTIGNVDQEVSIAGFEDVMALLVQHASIKVRKFSATR